MIRLTIKRILAKVAYIFQKLANYIYMTPQETRIIPWIQNNGDKTLRLDYDLDENSIVFDLGGYEGQWSSDIFAKYCCWIYIFEPASEFYTNIVNRFERNPKIFIYNFGLADQDKETNIYLNGDGTSIYRKSSVSQSVKFISIFDFIEDEKIKKINLMKVNIEGGEYDLLEYLIQSGLIHKINNLQVQFHDFIENAEERMKQIQDQLSKTHDLTYQYRFVWENWKVKIHN